MEKIILQVDLSSDMGAVGAGLERAQDQAWRNLRQMLCGNVKSVLMVKRDRRRI